MACNDIKVLRCRINSDCQSAIRTCVSASRGQAKAVARTADGFTMGLRGCNVQGICKVKAHPEKRCSNRANWTPDDQGGGATASGYGATAPVGGATTPGGGSTTPGGGATAPGGGITPGVATAPDEAATAPVSGATAAGGGDTAGGSATAAGSGATAAGGGATWHYCSCYWW